jgi:hypothetical protein
MSEFLKLAVLSGATVMGMILMIPIVWIWTTHRRKLEEMRLRHQITVAEETRAAIEAVRKEVAALRDTTTEYDVSFDTALHRMDSRMGNIEQRVIQLERVHENVRLGVVEENVRAVH